MDFITYNYSDNIRSLIFDVISKKNQKRIKFIKEFYFTCFKKHENKYTGDEIMGIGTLHKSNMVPIRRDSNNAKEIARMRRG